MYSQLAQRTQIIYRQGQEDAHKVTSLNEQLARKEQELAFERQQRSTSDSKRAKFGGILRKLFRRHTKATSQLEADLVKARQESQQNAEAAQHYLRKWTESMVSLQFVLCT